MNPIVTPVTGHNTVPHVVTIGNIANTNVGYRHAAEKCVGTVLSVNRGSLVGPNNRPLRTSLFPLVTVLTLFGNKSSSVLIPEATCACHLSNCQLQLYAWV